MYKIYIVRNTVNGKIYVGQTKQTLKRRWQGHLCASRNGSQNHFPRAIEKHGKSNFVMKQIDKAETGEWANLLEMAYIYLYQATNPELGYNGTMGGEGILPSESTKQKLSQATKRRWSDPAYRDKMTALMRDHNPNKGRKASEETRLRLSESHKGNPVVHSEETKRKIGASNSIALKGKKLSLETKKKLSEAMRRIRAERKGQWFLQPQTI